MSQMSIDGYTIEMKKFKNNSIQKSILILDYSFFASRQTVVRKWSTFPNGVIPYIIHFLIPQTSSLLLD